MMHYILIFYMATIGVSDGGMTTFTAEFNSLKACKEAAEQVREFKGFMSQEPKIICLPKGNNE